jgi:hypothetical protein
MNVGWAIQRPYMTCQVLDASLTLPVACFPRSSHHGLITFIWAAKSKHD